MDQQFENDFYGYEPQRPFTEKSGDAPAPQPEAEAFQPQKPLMDAPAGGQPAPEQGFNPIQHTAEYAGSGFVSMPPQQPPVQEGYPAAYPQQPAPQPEPRQTGYATAPQPEPPQTGYPHTQQPQQPYYVPQQQPYPYAPYTPPQPKPKANTVLIVVIIVMGVLLAAGLVGIVSFSMYRAQTGSLPKADSRIEQQIPEFTFPENGGGFFDVPATTAPPKEHTESDYSSKTVKDYAGIKLAEKPEDYKENSAYNAEYAFKTASASVVSVLCFTDSTDNNAKATSQGSGIIISSDGFIVTNSHVVNNSKTAYAIKVITADGNEYKAGVVGFDARTDLAVLKLDGAKGLKAATFGNSEKIELGEDLIVIGNPGGIDYQNSMTKGIVSAINRDASSKNIVKYIQTDAAINPGSSGGPAVNNCGQVIGVASAKIADEKYEGMCFCIPSAQVKKIADSLIRNGYVEGRVKIGISGNALTAAEAEQYQVPRGIMVYSVAQGGPCDGKGLQEEDIITKLGDVSITSFADIYEALESYKDGDKVKLTYYRPKDNKEHEIEITLQADK